MKKLFLVMCICILCLPAKADIDGCDLSQAVAYQAVLNQPDAPMSFHWPKKKKPKVEHLSNGNITIDGKEYTPVIKTSEAK